MPEGGSAIDQGVLYYIARGIRRATDYFFGPDLPQPVSAPAGTPPRSFDYPTGYNINIQPRNLEAISFEQMRNLADSFDLVRLCIETRKDQLARMKWQFSVARNPEERNGAYRQRSLGDPRLVELRDFFAYPDKEHSWQEWIRMLMEDLLVIDSPSIVPVADANGTLWREGNELYAFELVDGATIARKIDANGRTPQPPAIAYQQIIKGLPAVDFQRDQLVYKPRNIRVHKFFGFSPVEQIILTINIGLRRQLHLLNYYTEGNVPEALCMVPETWSADQITEFQEWFDAKLSGDSATRRRITFVPQAGQLTFTRDPQLKDELDEWLARVICYAFSLSPQAFVQHMNRATAESAVEQATAEGLTPILLWVEDLINFLVLRYFGYSDIKFSFLDSKDENPVEQALILKTYVDAGIKSRAEAREQLGEEPFPGSERYTITTSQGITPVENAIADSDEPVTSQGPQRGGTPSQQG